MTPLRPLSLLLFTLFAVPAHAATPCAFGAFVTETDPAGLNVRSLPSVTGKILGTLPPVMISPDLDGYHIKIEVDVLAHQDGWFQIANARDNTALTGKTERPVFSGTGWVSGTKLTVKSQASHTYATPRETSEVLLSLRDNATFDQDQMIDAAHLVECTDAWARVEIPRTALPKDVLIGPAMPSKGPVRVWLNKLCGLQETTCSSP